MKYEIDIFHYIDVYKKEWKRMAVLIVIALLITAVLQYMRPAIYQSTLVALSPAESGGSSRIGSFLGLPQLTTGISSADVIFSMLKSRRMRQDINEHFNIQDRPGFWWSLETYLITGGFAVEVKGPDPQMTEDIANFAIENLEQINLELQVTSQKPMVKVLDPAATGCLLGKKVFKKASISGLFVFMVYSLFVFFREYFSHINKKKAAKI